MQIKTIQEADLSGKKILLRVDFNVESKKGHIQEKFKIASAGETIRFILKNPGVRLALLSHLGRPPFVESAVFENLAISKKLGKSLSDYSLKKFVPDIEKVNKIKIAFVSDCVGAKVKKGLEMLNLKKVLLLENVRLHSADEVNDSQFSHQLAENFDIFVNDAFSVCHRDQSSVTGVASILPSFAGLRLQEEIKNLDKIRSNPTRPAVAVIGGAKIETKLPLINMLEKNYDYVLVGGKIAIEAQDQGLTFSSKVLLPCDYKEKKLDIGKKTIEAYKSILMKAKTILWNGPMGKFEEAPNDQGTIELIKVMISSRAFTVAGGGESVQVLEGINMIDKFSFVSTGGEAMLEYMCGNKLPGIEILRK